MKQKKWLFILVLAMACFGMSSCQDWGLMDDPAGNQMLPEPEPPTVDASYANVASPTIAKNDNSYYIISSNASIDGIEYQKGLMFRSTSNFVSFDGMTDENAYILSEVVDDWAAERIKELDGTVDDENIKMGEPSLRKVGDKWRVYYSVSGGTNASVIGYAVADSPTGPWEDKGEILSSESGSNFMAYGPSFFTSSDGSKHYLAYGKGANGIYITELNTTDSRPSGTAKQVAARTTGANVENATVFFYEGYYHILFSHYSAEGYMCTCHVAATEPMGDYADVAERSAIFTNQWALTRVINDHQLMNSDSWRNITGLDVCVEGNEGFVVHQAQVGSNDPVLHIRKLNWVKDSRRAKTPELPVPAISPEQYRGPVSRPDITPDLIAGNWHYGTLWAHMNSGVNDSKTFNADGTYSGGTWDFDPSTGILHLHSTEWNGEDVFLYLYAETNVLDNGLVLVASGYNDTFGDHPGAWMKKVDNVGAVEEEERQRRGFYNPSVVKDGNLFYVFSGNAGITGLQYEKGLLVQTSEDLYFYDPMGYALSGVIDGWAAAKLRELDPEIAEDARFTIDEPELERVNGVWRLYYSVTATGSSASVIGYAEANSIGAEWTDKGLVLSSDGTSAYKAVAPSICVANGAVYMAFGYGNETQGIFVVELDNNSQPKDEPTRVVRFFNADGVLQNPELIYSEVDNKFHLFVNNVGKFNYEYYADAATGPYYNRAKANNDIEGMYWNGRTMAPYTFPSETPWTGLGGLKFFNTGGKTFVAHQASNASSDEPVLHVRETSWLTIPVGEVYSPFLVVSPYHYDIDASAAPVTEAELMGTEWKYGTTFRHVDMCEMFTDITLNADKTLGGLAGTWDYNESTQQLSFVVSTWGGERIFQRVMRGVAENGNAILLGSGINTDFDKTAVWMKQVK